jgi:hypothetical protein
MGAFLHVAFRIRSASYRFLAARAIHICAFSIVLCSLCQRGRPNSQKHKKWGSNGKHQKNMANATSNAEIVQSQQKKSKFI